MRQDGFEWNYPVMVKVQGSWRRLGYEQALFESTKKKEKKKGTNTSLKTRFRLRSLSLPFRTFFHVRLSPVGGCPTQSDLEVSLFPRN